MAKRSPILGYNHNVRYRGVIFHVQTEDSGVLSPHLFTHLFHGGVIVSTRKLVYDAGASPEAIKALMQAQHKAVLKDLNKGVFDQKIDQYLAGTPGLEPRSASGRPSAQQAAVSAPSEAAPTTGSNSETTDDEEETRTRRRPPRDTMVDEKTASSQPEPRGVLAEPVPVSRSIPGTTPPTERPSRPSIGVEARPAQRSSMDSDAVEIHASPLPAMDAPPDERFVSPGQYALKRPHGPSKSAPTSSQVTGQVTVRGVEPAPHRPATRPPVAPRTSMTTPPLAVPRTATLPNRAALSQPPPTPRPAAKPGSASLSRSTVAPATSPSRSTIAPASSPSRATPPARTPVAGSNVVVTRPAVIVGVAPGPAPQRRRAGSEEQPRPFGQGLISEKSLDEVIHAYLSEEGDES